MTELRDSINEQSAERDAFMARRLRQFYDEQEADEGLRDWRAGALQATRDEESAAGLIGWMAVVVLGIALGTVLAYWMTGDGPFDRIAVATPVECAK